MDQWGHVQEFCTNLCMTEWHGVQKIGPVARVLDPNVFPPADATDSIAGLFYLIGSRDPARGEKLIRVGIELGDPVAMYIGAAYSISRGEPLNGLLEQSATLGCRSAMILWARDLAQRNDLKHAAIWMHRADALDLIHLSELTIPYGIWQPNRIYHYLVSAAIHWQVKTMLLVARRRRIPRHVALLICAYIVTK